MKTQKVQLAEVMVDQGCWFMYINRHVISIEQLSCIISNTLDQSFWNSV